MKILMLLIFLSAFFVERLLADSFMSDSACKVMAERITKEIAESGSCKEDSDCVREFFGCPWGCATVLNRHKVGKIKKMIAEFNCPPCKNRCEAEESIPELVCLRENCIVKFPNRD